MPIQHLDSVLVQWVINEEPADGRAYRRWSLNMVVQGQSFQVGPLVAAATAADAGIKFIDVLWPPR